ncbi:MAG: hypothetical protein HY721_02375 [Planctomycetes bacterium]|nr:hypothetical protein [Planctomycetota bacterium]
MRQLRLLGLPALLFLGFGGLAQALDALPKFSGAFYPPITPQTKNGKSLNPTALAPATENCTDGADGDEDTFVDWNDLDCMANLAQVMVQWKTPLSVLQGIAGNPPPRIFAAGQDATAEPNRAGVPVGEIGLNTTGPGGKKQGYLRTAPPNSYSSVRFETTILPGVEWAGVTAIRINGTTGESYYAKVGIGNTISINKQNADGTSTVLASKTTWDNGDPIDIKPYDTSIQVGTHTCYEEALSAVGSAIDLKVKEVNCATSYFQDEDKFPPTHVATLAATDGTLAEGFVGLRADNDGGPGGVDLDGNPVPDDNVSSNDVDPGVLRVGINDPSETPSGPRILFHGSTGSSDLRDGADFNRNPVRPVNANASAPEAKNEWDPGKNDAANQWNRSNGSISQTSLQHQLEAAGFNVTTVEGDIYELGDALGGIYTVADVNERYDLVITNSSDNPYRGSPHTSRELEIPWMTSEHVETQNKTEARAGMGASNSGNENRQTDCTPGAGDEDALLGDPGFDGLQNLVVISEGQGGEPDHPIVKGLADPMGLIRFYDNQMSSLNVGWDQSIVKSLSGAPFLNTQDIAVERTWPGTSQTQYMGYPLAPGGVPLLTQADPCTNAPLFSIDETTAALNNDGKGHIAFAVFEAGTSRLVPFEGETDPPSLCPEPCRFEARAAFYPISDGHAHTLAADGRRLIRRLALWLTGYLDNTVPTAGGGGGVGGIEDVVGRDELFQRGNANDDGNYDLSDAVFTLSYLFIGGETPPCLNAADANDDNKVDISDGVYSLGYLFLGGPAPPNPFFGAFHSCGLDFTPAPGSPPAEFLSCESFSNCPNN